MMPRTLIPLTAAAAALVLAGCGGGGTTTSAASTSATATTATTAATTVAAGIDPMRGAGTSPVHAPATHRQVALLTGVRAARHEGFDRVVFQFRNVVPGYDVRYVRRPLREDGSGKVVPIKGAYVLRVRMENALDADLTKEDAPMTYKGPRRFTPATPEIAELVKTGGFEAVLTWAIGVRDRVDFRVSTLRAPARLVVDLRNH